MPKKKYRWIWILISMFFIFVSMYANYIWLTAKGDSMGKYGDIFGVSNALFTGIALVFLIYGILQQREEIKIAKEDLERTKDILEEQSKHMELQKFNDQFFSLINALENFIINFEYRNMRGNSAINLIKNDIFDELRKIDYTIPINNFDKEGCEKVKGVMNRIHGDIIFRDKLESVNQIIKLTLLITEFINKNKDNIDIWFYFGVLEACVSNSIKNILMLHLHYGDEHEMISIAQSYGIAKWP